MHDLLFESQQRLGQPLLIELGRRLRLDVSELEKALQAEQFAERVQRDFSGGVRRGVNGTPTFFVNAVRHDDDFELGTPVNAIESQRVKT